MTFWGNICTRMFVVILFRQEQCSLYKKGKRKETNKEVEKKLKIEKTKKKRNEKKIYKYVYSQYTTYEHEYKHKQQHKKNYTHRPQENDSPKAACCCALGVCTSRRSVSLLPRAFWALTLSVAPFPPSSPPTTHSGKSLKKSWNAR